MTKPEKTNHWKSLAALLGTAPPNEPEATEAISEPGFIPDIAVPAPAPPPAAEKKSPPAPPPPPKAPPPPKPTPVKRTGHWGKLANVLGLGGSPEVEPAEPEIQREPVQESRELSSLFRSTEDTSDAAAMAASHWDVPETDRGIDPLEMTAEPFVDEAFDAVDLDSLESPAPSTDESADERRRRRRRRRGRGRGRRGDREPAVEPSADSIPLEDTPILAADAAMDAVSELEELGPVADSDSEEGPERGEEDQDGGQRRRRRRRRGRRGRREDSDSPAPAGRSEPKVRAKNVPEDKPRDDDDDDLDLDEDSLVDLHDDDDDDDGAEKDDDLHLSHKKIPSWYEAIEAVIATNMSSRASNPSSGSRNRGGSGGRGRRDR